MIEISVIIPAHNASNSIIRCLDSLKNSPLSNFEVIVVDDASTDDTVATVERYISSGNAFVKLVKNKINQGPSLSRKNGIEKSNGIYMAFVDSDDYVETDFLSTLYESSKRNASDITICDYYVVNNRGKRKIKKVATNYEAEKKSSRLLLSIDSFCTCLIKKNLFNNITFPNIRNGEDMAVIPQLLERANKVYYVSKPLYNYVYYKASLSNSFSKSKVQSLVTSFEIIEASLGEKYPSETEFLGIRNLLYGGLLAIFKHNYDKESANMLINGFELKYPRWYESKYIKLLPFYKKFFVKNVKKRNWMVVRMLCYIHSILK